MPSIHVDALPHNLRCALQRVEEVLTGVFVKIYSHWWGVELGAGVSFCGLPRFRRPPAARIRIGSRCRFLSRFSANLHGINRPCMLAALDRGAVIEIGEDCGMSGTVVSAKTRVEIGNRVLCGANTTISDTDSHPLDYRQRNPTYFDLQIGMTDGTKSSPVKIDDDVWLGMNVVVLKGVHIGKGVVVAANSVVATSLPEHVLAGGSPARIIRKLS